VRRLAVAALLAGIASTWLAAGPARAESQHVAALQVALRSKGLYKGAIDGVSGPQTWAGLKSLQKRTGIARTGKVDPATRRALGRLGEPLLGRRELAAGVVGWDVSALEFRLLPYGLPATAVDGRFTAATSAALRRFQRAHGLSGDGIAGPKTFRALVCSAQEAARPKVVPVHVVKPGEGFFVVADRYKVDASKLAKANGLSLTSVLVPGQRLRLPAGAAVPVRSISTPETTLAHRVLPGDSWYAIAERYGVSPWDLAQKNGKQLDQVIVPGMRLTLPAGARVAVAAPGAPPPSPSLDAVRIALDRWSAEYGVDAKLARALAWMESGFQNHVVSPVGARGVMQLLPETWDFVEEVLIGRGIAETAEGNVRVGVRYLRWQLDEFAGDVRLALAGWYQGARAVRERGLYDDTKEFVRIVLELYGKV
jgi:peptidoglycan hydrolase-like protein with peptidoglycan-binding domain